MVFKAVVKDNLIAVPDESPLPDGTLVRVETLFTTRFSDLLPLAGSWTGDDVERIVDEIYRARSSARPRATFDE